MTSIRRGRLASEGCGRLYDAELARVALPLRFTPGLCLLAAVAAIAGAARRHPFDLLWKHIVRPAVGGAHLPRARCPRRSALVTATPVLGGAGLSFALGAEALGFGLAILQLSGCAAYVFTGRCGRSAAPRASTA